jgi:hypothetical protein
MNSILEVHRDARKLDLLQKEYRFVVPPLKLDSQGLVF